MSLLSFFKDPPPEFAIEIAADGIALSRTKPPVTVQSAPLATGVLSTSPVRENVLDAAAFNAAVKSLVPAGRGKRRTALILPDNSVRIAVLDFDRLPEKETEARSLINFRLRKSVPFDIDDAALSYFTQPGNKVVAAFAPMEIVAHYEAPFRAAGLEPGFVTVSALATLDLLPPHGSCLVAKRSPGNLTLLAVDNGVIAVARSIEFTDEEEVSAGIYTTLAFVEDQTGKRPEKLYFAGFEARPDIELDIEVETLSQKWSGLEGFVRQALLPAAGSQPARSRADKKAAA